MNGTTVTVKHAAIYSAAAMLGKLIGFMMLPFYAHKLGTAGYGIIGMVDASLSLLTGFIAYGLRGTLIRLYHGEEDKHGKNLVISTGLWLTTIMVASLVLIAGIFSVPLSEFLFGMSDLSLILLLALGSFLFDTVGQTAGTVLIIERRSVIFSVIGLIRLVVGLSLNILLIIVFDYGVYGFFISALVCALLSLAIFSYYSITQCGLGYDRDIAGKIVRYHSPLVPGALISFFALQSERILLRFFESIQKVGILEMAYKFPTLIMILIHTPMMRSWDTERVSLAEEKGEGASEYIGSIASLSLLLCSTGALLIAVCIDDILKITTPPDFWEATRIAQIECVTLVLYSITFHVNFGYFLKKDTKSWTILTSSIAILKVALSAYFIYVWGLWGAAYSALICQALTLILSMRGGQARFYIKYNHNVNFTIVTLATCIFIATELLSSNLAAYAETIANILSPMVNVSIEPSTLEKLWAKLPLLIDMCLRALFCLPMFGLLFYLYPEARKKVVNKMMRRTT